MANLEHSFPLPETETHKLDEVKEVLEPAEASARGAGLLVSRPWLVLAVAAVGGLLFGLWWRSRT